MPDSAFARATVRGKFFDAGGSRLYVRGVTYGTFPPDGSGDMVPRPDVVERDFEQMAAAGVNAVRLYAPPPGWLLDAAGRHGIRVLVGLALERWIGRYIEGAPQAEIEAAIREAASRSIGHPAVLAYVLANEIPASTVRWLGRRRLEALLRGLQRVLKRQDPGSLVTYANYPTTEYLQLDFLDFLCWNVFLESEGDFGAYIARLQTLAGDRPLVITEMGLDSRRNGERRQARIVSSQVRRAFEGGCAGAFVFAWTDDWHTSAGEVVDWDFGLVRRDRTPKPALRAVRSAFAEVPSAGPGPVPRVSVVVCTYNGARTLRDCLDGVRELAYPDYETIVVDDGSTDESAAIAAEFPVRLIRTPQRGLGNARNTGLEAATGEIVAYTDDDARPDRDWLTHLVLAFGRNEHVGMGGPNIAPPGLGLISDCVAEAPGNPTHVLLGDDEAEHIPGCNMAFRRSALQSIGGFDPRFRAAGDDVDICWRLRDRGWTLGFAAGATVWHRPRWTIGGYWRQQRGYGRAEALLEAKWAERYTATGLAIWHGRVYGPSAPVGLSHVYHGVWGSAPFQSLYEPAAGLLAALPLIPEWYLALAGLAAITALGVTWPPLLLAGPILLVAVALSVTQAIRGARRARVAAADPVEALRRRMVIAGLHLLQPAARLWGRLAAGLTPWRRRRPAGVAWPLAADARFLAERRQAPDAWIGSIERTLRDSGAVVLSGGPFDGYDLEVRGGLFGGVRVLLAFEDHSAGQLVRVRHRPTWSTRPWLAAAAAIAVSAGAAGASAWLPALVFAGLATAIVGRAVDDAGAAMAAVRLALHERVETAAVRLATRPGDG